MVIIRNRKYCYCLECSPKPLDLSHGSMRWRAHRKLFERGGWSKLLFFLIGRLMWKQQSDSSEQTNETIRQRIPSQHSYTKIYMDEEVQSKKRKKIAANFWSLSRPSSSLCPVENNFLILYIDCYTMALLAFCFAVSLNRLKYKNSGG